MSCYKCHHITGHSPSCEEYAIEAQYEVEQLRAIVSELVERVEKLESWKEDVINADYWRRQHGD